MIYVNERRMLQELMENGHVYNDSNIIYEQKTLSPKVVAIILKWLPSIYNEHVGTANILVGSLISAAEPFNPALLIDFFENSELSSSFKSGIANTLGKAKTTDISVWIRNQLLNYDHSIERVTLTYHLYEKGGFLNSKEFIRFLEEIFDKYHNDEVIRFFKKYGDREAVPFLEDKLRVADKRTARGIVKVIESINKRK